MTHAAEFMAAQQAIREAKAVCSRILREVVCSEFPQGTVGMTDDGAAQIQDVLFRLKEGPGNCIQYVVVVGGRVTVTSQESFRAAMAKSLSRSVREALIRLEGYPV
jgi:hypothetical protein